MLDRAVTEPILQRPGIMAGVRQGVAAGVADHVAVDRESKAGALTDALDKPIDGVRCERAVALALKMAGGGTSAHRPTRRRAGFSLHDHSARAKATPATTATKACEVATRALKQAATRRLRLIILSS
jgi:hypothetical protein